MLGAAVRERRTTLGLSIEEAAAKAGIGTKTWSRYEAGAAIRQDKVRGLCKALGWSQLPEADGDVDETDENWLLEIGEDHEAWSSALEENCGRACAATFAAGSDLLSDQANDDLTALAREPRGTHVGQLDASWLCDSLPPQFLTRYDYDFVYALKAAIGVLRKRFANGSLVVESVIEELAVYLILSQADMFADFNQNFFDEDDDWHEWLGDILGDLDVEFFLYDCGWSLTPRMTYHFSHWLEAQFNAGDHAMTATERAADFARSLYTAPTESDATRPSK